MPHTAVVRRTLAGALAGALAISGSALIVGASPASAVQGFAFDRLAGSDRYGTAASIAAETFPGGTSKAVIARGNHFADALAANYLAGVLGAPVLLTATDELPEVTADSLTALDVQDVYIVGGVTAVSASVEDELDDGYAVVRIGRSDRYLTAQAIAEEAAGQAGSIGSFQGLTTAVLASGQDFPDALALGPIAYSHGFPLLLTRPGALPAATRATLRNLGIDRVIIAGETTAVSPAVQEEVEEITGSAAIRLGGRTRFETATDIAHFAYDALRFDDTHVVLARGDSPRGFADALTGGAVAGTERAPIVLTNPTALPTATRTFLEQRSGTLVDGHLLGGVAAVSNGVEQAAETAAQGPAGVRPTPSSSPSASASPSTGASASASPSASPSGAAAVAGGPATVVSAKAVDTSGDDGIVVTFNEPVQGLGTYALRSGVDTFAYEVGSGEGSSRLVLAPTAAGADFDAADDRTYTLRVTDERDVANDSTTTTKLVDESGTRPAWIEVGQTRVLSVDSGQLFPTLQQALDAEQPGGSDTLRAFSAKGGAFREVVTITKDVTVEGAGDGDAVTPDDRTDLAGSFIVAADGVTVSGFDLTGFGLVRDEPRPAAVQVVGGSTAFLIDDNTMTSSPSTAGIGFVTDLSANSGRITNNVITGGDLGIYLQGTTTAEGLRVDGNTVAGTGNGSSRNGAVASDAPGLVVVSNNVFDDNAGASLELFRAGATVTDNDFRDQDGVQVSDVANSYDESALVATNTFDRAVTAPAGVFSALTDAVGSLSAEAQTVVVHPGDGSTYTGNAVVARPRTVVRGSEDAAGAASVRVAGTISVVADDVQVRSLRLSPGSTGAVETTSLFLQDVSRVLVQDNLFEGDGAATGLTQRGIINSISAGTEMATIQRNTFTGLTSGVFANPSADFLVADNRFASNFAGSSNDAPTELTRNTFVGNVEAVGLGAIGPALLENRFADNDRHVCDYTPGSNPLQVFQQANTYDGPTTIRDGSPRCIVTTSVSSGPIP